MNISDMNTEKNFFAVDQTDVRLGEKMRSSTTEFIDHQDIRRKSKHTEPSNPTEKSNEQHHRHIAEPTNFAMRSAKGKRRLCVTEIDVDPRDKTTKPQQTASPGSNSTGGNIY